MKFATLTAEPSGDEVRVENFLGDPHLVAPVVLVREGVLNGGFLSFEEIQNSVLGWDDRPVTAPTSNEDSGHPTDENGEFVSARAAEVLERHGVGFLQNVEARDDLDSSGDKNPRGLVGEVWTNLKRAKAVGDAALEAARRMAKGEPLDVSTGYYHVLVENSGRFEGEPYDHEQVGLVPDHLALLPNERGACSWDHGCGAPRTNADHATALQANGYLGEPILAANTADEDLTGAGKNALDRLKARLAGNCGSCGGTCADCSGNNMDADDYEALAEATGVSVETLKAMSSDDLSALAETAEAVTASDGGDDGDGDGATDDGKEQTTAPDGGSTPDGDGTDDGGDGDGDASQNVDMSEALQEIRALRDEVEDLREQANRDPQADAAREFLAENSEHERDSLDEWPDEAVVTAANAYGFSNYAAPRGDRVNRLGQGGAPAAVGNGAPSEDDLAGMTGNIGAIQASGGED